MSSAAGGDLVRTEEEEQEDHAERSAAPYLFVVLHCDRPLLGGARWSLSTTEIVTLGRGDERAFRRDEDGGRRRLALTLPGSTLSSLHARLVRSDDRWSLVDAQSKNGTLRNGERISRVALRDGDFIQIGPVVLRFREALPAPRDASPDLDSATMSPLAMGLATLLPELAERHEDLARVAETRVPVLLIGETGTGKELVGRAVHTLSKRPGPFVAVNCGALPGSLLEAQLFGHVKGAFTGAIRDEPGTVRAADGGTLFLDEIGDLPPSAQAVLLRVLEEREVVPVGGSRAVKVDLRVVAATHKPLEEMVLKGEFRGDLLARLSGYRHSLVPLRERLEDMGLLVADILRRPDVPRGASIRFKPESGRKLVGSRFPFNVRELSQSIAVAAALSRDGVIAPSHLPDGMLEAASEPSSEGIDVPSDPEALRRYLIALLEKHEGKVAHVARDLGKARMQVHRWMQRFGLDPDDYRSRG